jgi:RpiB/LacA/LacB family sugar-phosphate isomerase
VAARSGVTLKQAKPGGPSAKPGAATAATPPVAASPSNGGAPTIVRSVAVGADHGGVALRDAIAGRLKELGHNVTDHGTTGSAAVDYPDYAVAVARAVASGAAQLGIMVDGAGIGSCMAANKIPGVRAAMCYDVTTAQNAREHNNANVLTLGGGLIGTRLAIAIVETFLATGFGGGRHAGRVAKIDALDASRPR